MRSVLVLEGLVLVLAFGGSVLVNITGTSTQKGQFVPTGGEGNRLSRLSMANEIQCILPYVTR